MEVMDRESGVSADAVDYVRDAIRSGRIGPGDRIVERSVAHELGISSIAVRDAFARLVHEGWIERRPRRGVRVRRLGLDQVDDITAVRSLLEGEAAMRAAARIAAVGDADLCEITVAMRQAARRGDRSELLMLDDAFHGALWRLAASATLEELLLNLRSRVTPLVRRSLDNMSSAYLRRMETWHVAFIAALHKGEIAARAEATRHAYLTRDRIRTTPYLSDEGGVSDGDCTEGQHH